MRDRPTVEEANELPLDELAMRILRFFEPLEDNNNWISRRGIGNPGSWATKDMTPEDRADALAASRRATEAWDWLLHHGLVAPRQEATGFTETGHITEMGRKVLASDRGLATMRAEERLNIDLHPILERKVRAQFLLGDYELAAFAAMKQVEIRVRDLGGYDDALIGVQLMRAAFSHEEGKLGKLADPAQIVAEREGTAHLFHGAIAVFKNPTSHRQVDFEDPTVAVEIVLLADLLLRILDRVETRLTEDSSPAPPETS